MGDRGTRVRTAIAVAACAALVTALASAGAASGETQALPVQLKDCKAVWLKAYVPRAPLDERIPAGYESYAGQQYSPEFDGAASTALGNLYLQTYRCMRGEGASAQPVEFSTVAAQVKPPAGWVRPDPLHPARVFEPGDPIHFPANPEEEGYATVYEHYYLLAVATDDAQLAAYLQSQGLPVESGDGVDVAVERDWQEARLGTVATRVRSPWSDYEVLFATPVHKREGFNYSPMHQHVTLYYHDTDKRLVINSLIDDWNGNCTTTTRPDSELAQILPGPANDQLTACFYVDLNPDLQARVDTKRVGGE